MGKPGLTADRSASGAMVNTIIRRVYMGTDPKKNARQPKQNNFRGNAMSTVIMFNKWREAVKNDCACVSGCAANGSKPRCVKAGKNTGCGC